MLVKKLKENVIKHLSAGEVVESPSSCIKELVENSLDAGAEKIEVYFKAGGLQEIRVIDDGEGIHPDDLPDVVKRYTTSKIEELNDIFSIESYGFRGEALYAICSVSKLEITSRFSGIEEGKKLIAEGGKILEVKPAPVPFKTGTEVKVRELFFNVPVRKKFARSQSRESSEILETLRRILIPLVQVELKAFSEKGEVLYIPSREDIISRFSISTGIEDSFLKFKGEKRGIKVWGWISPPDKTLRTSKKLYTYVNRRWVRNEVILGAVLSAFGNMIQKGNYPAGIIFIEVDPSFVDVNVHPRKETVRFGNPAAIYEIIRESVSNAFKNLFVDEEVSEKKFGGLYSYNLPPDLYAREYPPSSPMQMKEAYLFNEEIENYKYLGIVFGKFGVIEFNESLYFIDLHAASERVIYAELMKGVREGNSGTHQLLVPESLNLNQSIAVNYEEIIEVLKKMGFDIESLGPSSYAIRSVPETLSTVNVNEVLKKVMEDLAEIGKTMEELSSRICSLIACHSAVRGIVKARGPDVIKLLKKFLSGEVERYCPHGRPVMFKISKYDIEKNLGRI